MFCGKLINTDFLFVSVYMAEKLGSCIFAILSAGNWPNNTQARFIWQICPAIMRETIRAANVTDRQIMLWSAIAIDNRIAELIAELVIVQ